MSSDKFIEVEKLIASKSPKAARRVPQFVIRYLKRIVHEKHINEFIAEHKDKKNVEWCEEVVNYMDISLEVKNLEKIPKTGNIVIAMNHPLGGMDAMILVSALKGYREDLKFIVNDILLNLESMKEMFVGIDKHSSKRSEAYKQIDALFNEDNAVCIFPAGLVSRKQKGEVVDLEWKKTFVTYAKKYERDIVPIYIDGKLSKFFYRLSNIRKFLGVKTNIEMLYLSNELFKQKNKHMKFVVGNLIPYNELKKEKNDRKLAEEIREKVYELRNQL